MNMIKKKFKKGVASFYIVAFSTLILLIVATSFATVIISEIERTSNDDLSQSAYDSAMAGIEDGKLAFYNYQNCLAEDVGNCGQIKTWMTGSDCYMVGRTLGRLAPGEVGEVQINESGDNNMQQAYTCVKVNTVLSDYRATLSSTKQLRVVKVKFDNVRAREIAKVRISWYSDADRSNYRYANFSGNKVVFPQISGATSFATPPTISLAMVQTADNFTLDDFEASHGDTTDRGMVYLVPTNGIKTGDSNQTYSASVWSNAEKTNKIGANAFVNSNDKVSVNLPYAVNCPKNGSTEFACSATIDLPGAVNGERSDDTFMFAVALPYGGPSADFALEFLCSEGKICATNTYQNESGGTETVQTNQANLNGVQVEIDSTGRANDIYRRVKVRLESGGNDSNLALMGPLELLGGGTSGVNAGSGLLLNKNLTVKSEYNF